MATDRDESSHEGSADTPDRTGQVSDWLRRTWKGTKEAVADAFDDEDRTSRPGSAAAPNPLAEEPVLVIPEPRRPSRSSYENRGVGELRELAARRGIRGRSRMTKDELIAALRD